MEQVNTVVKAPEVSATPEVDKKRALDEDNLNEVLGLLAATLTPTEEDKDQENFVVALQKNRKFLLEFAMQDYMIKPSPGKLETITSLLAHMEKVVRDDRKERTKKQESQDNAISFKQMLDAMSMIKQGSIQLPVFEMSNFMLDPSESLLEGLVGVKPILAQELVQGNEIADINGNAVK